MVGIALSIGLGAALLPLRAHLSIAVAALVFVLPVVAGVTIGGFGAGAKLSWGVDLPAKPNPAA